MPRYIAKIMYLNNQQFGTEKVVKNIQNFNSNYFTWLLNLTIIFELPGGRNLLKRKFNIYTVLRQLPKPPHSLVHRADVYGSNPKQVSPGCISNTIWINPKYTCGEKAHG